MRKITRNSYLRSASQRPLQAEPGDPPLHLPAPPEAVSLPRAWGLLVTAADADIDNAARADLTGHREAAVAGIGDLAVVDLERIAIAGVAIARLRDDEHAPVAVIGVAADAAPVADDQEKAAKRGTGRLKKRIVGLSNRAGCKGLMPCCIARSFGVFMTPAGSEASG